jgi:putative phosphoribosyl transferase
MFKDREDAGKKLSEKLAYLKGESIVVLAIPRGGVPVGFQVALSLKAPLDLIIPRKIPIPSNPEAGFGAVTEDGTLVLNHKLTSQLGLTKSEIEQLAEEVREEIRRRRKLYPGKIRLPDIAHKKVILTDDGLASGYTMLAAIKSIKKFQPKSILVAVPVASTTALELIKESTVEIICLHKSHRFFFAVADFYEKWADLSDEEVIAYLEKARTGVT